MQFPENIYAQLSEYTFGDSIQANIRGNSTRLLKPENVGYNIFAQRDGVLPAKDNVPVKPDGASPPVLTVLKCINGQCTEEEKKTLRYGEAVQRMQDLWGTCVTWPGEDLVAQKLVSPAAVCPADADLKGKLTAVREFFAENHRKYLAEYVGKCKGTTPEVPTFTYWQAIKHIYGWVPFNEGCGADDNKLANTSIPDWDHAKIQSMYIHDLQYNHQQAAVKADNRLLFNPYVELIHDNLQMNAYGFSVDDAVGFMSELGDGIIFAVGGSDGLETLSSSAIQTGLH